MGSNQMPEDVKCLLESSLAGENKKVADEYLVSRGLRAFPDVGYMKVLPFRGRFLSDVVLFFIRDVMGEVVAIQTRGRSVKDYLTLWETEGSIPIFGAEQVPTAKTVVITESVINALSLRTVFPDLAPGIVFCSTLGANLPLQKNYFLSVLTFKKKLVLGFDNDSGGIKGASECASFRKEKFGLTSKILDFVGSDLNGSLNKYGAKFLYDTLLPQMV